MTNWGLRRTIIPLPGKQLQKYRSSFAAKKEAKEEYFKLMLSILRLISTHFLPLTYFKKLLYIHIAIRLCMPYIVIYFVFLQ